jgi:hypothetical protein
MPQMLPPETVQFVVRDGAPTILLAVDMPADLIASEWSLMNRLTLVVVDGPGDAGFLLPRLTPAGDAAPGGWDEAIDRAGGSYVVFGAEVGAPTVFARSVD